MDPIARSTQRSLEEPADTPAGRRARRGRRQATLASSAAVLIGAWLPLAPLVLDYPTILDSGVEEMARGAGVWNDIIVGVLVMVSATVRASAPARAPAVSLVTAVLGGWLALSPFLLGHADVGRALVNDVVSGLALAALGLYSYVVSRRMHASDW